VRFLVKSTISQLTRKPRSGFAACYISLISIHHLIGHQNYPLAGNRAAPSGQKASAFLLSDNFPNCRESCFSKIWVVSRQALNWAGLVHLQNGVRGYDWNHLAQNTDQWRALVNSAMYFWVPHKVGMSSSLESNFRFSGRCLFV
jgi:hypothetical protein